MASTLLKSYSYSHQSPPTYRPTFHHGSRLFCYYLLWLGGTQNTHTMGCVAMALLNIYYYQKLFPNRVWHIWVSVQPL